MGGWLTCFKHGVMALAVVFGLTTGMHWQASAQESQVPVKAPVKESEANQIAPEKIYPYIVPKQYFDQTGDSDGWIARPLGHGLSVVLVVDFDNLVGNVSKESLAKLGLTAEQAHARALKNLYDLLRGQKIPAQSYPNGPGGRPVIIASHHWAAAACLLLPEMRSLAVKAIGTQDLCASIPHRDALWVFAKGDKKYRDSVVSEIAEYEKDPRKPLTAKLFSITESGPVPFSE